MAVLHIYQDRYYEGPYMVLSERLPNERRDFISARIQRKAHFISKALWQESFNAGDQG